MNPKRHLLLIPLCSILLSEAALCQVSAPDSLDWSGPRQTITGTVRAIGTGQPVVGATVMVRGTKLGAHTDVDGSFRIGGVPVGRRGLRVQSIGFEPREVQIVLTSGRQAFIDLELRESVVQAKEVVVTADPFRPINTTALSSAQSFTVSEVNRFAGGFQDPAWIAQNFAGMVGTSDKMNEIVVRGGAPTELLWRLDGIDIPNPSHFATQGISGGPISAINSNLLANSDFFTGAFPAEYGGRLSGVFDLRTRRGNKDRYEFVAQIGMNGLEGLAEGPIPAVPGSFIASYRKSTLEAFDLLGISFGIGALKPTYEDATLKIDVSTGASDQIALTAVAGTSGAEEDPSEISSPGALLTRMSTSLGAAGVTWTRFVSTTMLAQFTVAVTGNSYKAAQDSLVAAVGEREPGRQTVWEREGTESSVLGRLRFNWAPDHHNQVSLGADERRLFYSLRDAHPQMAAAGDPSRVDASGAATLGTGFMSWYWRPSEQLSVTSGLFVQYLAFNSRISLEPRISGAWRFSPIEVVSLAFGVHRQMQPLVVYAANPANRQLDYTRSTHFVAGYSRNLTGDLAAKVETYLKLIADAPVTRFRADGFSLLNVGPDFDPGSVTWALRNAGRGRTYGLELSLMKNFSDGWYAIATGSLYRQQYAGSDGIWRFGVFDNVYVANLVGGFEVDLSKGLTLESSVRFSIGGGRRFTPIDLDSSRIHGTTWFDYSQPYRDRLPYYSRLDLRIDFRQSFENWSVVGYVSLLNLLNRRNIAGYSYDSRTGEIDTDYQLGLIPVGGIRAEF